MKLNICILWRPCKQKEKQVDRSERACEKSVVAFPLFYLNEKHPIKRADISTALPGESPAPVWG